MGQQIIKQPNGLYAVWSTVSDSFIMWDCAPEDIIQDRIEEETQRIREGVLKTCAELAAGKKPYYQFTMSFNEAVDLMHKNHKRSPEDLADLARVIKDANDPLTSEATV